MEVKMEPLQRQMLDDVFDAFNMLANGGMVTLMHVDGGYTRYTKSAVELFGLPGEYIPNGAMDWNDYIHPEDRKRYMDAMMPLLEGKTQTYDLTYRVKLKKGGYQAFRFVGAVLRGSDGKPSLIGGAVLNEGLTNRVDPVTILPNKNAFQEDLARELARSQKIFLLQIGINQFQDINKVYGYSYGNRIIQEMAWLIQKAVGERGKIYRLDGATFAIMAENISRERIAALYDHLRYQLQRGIEVNGTNNILTANGGMLSTFGEDEDVTTICSCLNYAYNESANHMHGELVDFNGSLSYENTDFISMIGEIRNCIEHDCVGFHLEYLPVIAVKTELINGAETKIYWENEKYGRIDSEIFLPILEQDFIFEELGDFILKQGLTDGVKFLEVNPNFYLCLNVYRIQLESGYFVENIMNYVKESGFPTRLLSLKFDSDCRLIGMEKMKEIIAELHANNIIVIIGDFGSGVDSIGFLKSEPVDAVSIAKQFTIGIDDDVKNQRTLEYLAAMARDYVQHVNVKGVDTAQLRDVVENFPVTTMQGDFFSKPLPFDKMYELVQNPLLIAHY